MINQNFFDFIDKCNIKPGYRSDHSNIELLITLNKFERGRGLWKFNCSLLKDKDYLILVNNLIDQEKLRYSVPIYNPVNVTQIPDSEICFTLSDSHFLEVLLMQIRGETIRYASLSRKKTREKEELLKVTIDNMEKNHELLDSEELLLKKNELQSIRNNKMNGLMLRSRAQWLREGEKPSKYFCSLEKFYYTEKTIRKLTRQDGQVITDQKEILNEVKGYYQNLFKNKDSEIDEINTEFLKPYLTKLSEHEAKGLEGILTIDEIGQALKNMKNNKCPGIDGFPADFYKIFWSKLKFFVLRSLNHGFLSGQFLISLRQCIISCLPKGDKPRQFLKNWRPISLLSVVYKIASSALSFRLKKVLHNLLSKTQSGFMSNRFIGESTRLIYDIMYYTQYNDIPGMLMLIDFQKAFDSVSWKFLQTILTLFGFKEGFCNWIKILNTNVRAAVLQSGKLSDFFAIEQGCRQGDPISAYLFLLCAEVMFVLINNETSLKGIEINGNEFKITQFADDTTLILDGSRESLLAALNVLETFGSISGLKINTDKTKLIWIGKKRYSKCQFDVGKIFEWGTKNFDLLGIKFSIELDDMIDLNYIPVLEQIEKLFYRWNQRYLTPVGKIAVIKTLALSKLNHLFMALPNPSQDILRKIDNMFFKFIWNGKPDKIKRKTLTKSYMQGGLSMIDTSHFLSALKITWVRRLYMNPQSIWAILAKCYLGSTHKLVLLGNYYSESLAKKTTNKFWTDVLQSWSKFLKAFQMEKNLNALSQSLWCNANISKIELFFPKWFERGIILIGDLLSANGELLSKRELEQSYSFKTNFLEYYRITSTVKIYLKKYKLDPKIFQKPLYPNQIKVLCNSEKGSQDFYRSLNYHGLSIENTPISYWMNLYDETPNESLWRNIFGICFKTVMDNDLIWLQIRVLYRILGTNDLLLKVSKHDDGKCSFCHNQLETITHLFAECQIVKQFWSQLKDKLKLVLQIGLNLNPTCIIWVLRKDSKKTLLII